MRIFLTATHDRRKWNKSTSCQIYNSWKTLYLITCSFWAPYVIVRLHPPPWIERPGSSCQSYVGHRFFHIKLPSFFSLFGVVIVLLHTYCYFLSFIMFFSVSLLYRVSGANGVVHSANSDGSWCARQARGTMATKQAISSIAANRWLCKSWTAMKQLYQPLM